MKDGINKQPMQSQAEFDRQARAFNDRVSDMSSEQFDTEFARIFDERIAAQTDDNRIDAPNAAQAARPGINLPLVGDTGYQPGLTDAEREHGGYLPHQDAVERAKARRMGMIENEHIKDVERENARLRLAVRDRELMVWAAIAMWFVLLIASLATR